MKLLQLGTLVAVVFGVVAFLVRRTSYPEIDTTKFSEVIGVVAVLEAIVGGWFSRKGVTR